MIGWTIYVCDWVNWCVQWAAWCGEWAIYAAVVGTLAREWLGDLDGTTLTLKIGGIQK